MNTPIATVGYPEKFELALKYGEHGPLASNPEISDSDRLLFYALACQAQHGPCNEPRPSMWDTVAKAKWNAWKELGDRSKFEAMVRSRTLSLSGPQLLLLLLLLSPLLLLPLPLPLLLPLPAGLPPSLPAC